MPASPETQLYQAGTVQQQLVNPPSVIQIGTVEATLGVVAVILSVGIAWGTLKTLVSGMKKTLDEEIKPDLKDVRERFSATADKVDTLWKDKYAPAHSPRQLNERGTDILNKSGIKEIVDEQKNKLLAIVKEKKPTNPYDAEMMIMEVMQELPKHCPEVIDSIKEGAFKTGVDIAVVLLVGGTYLRNIIFPELGFSLDDLDKPKANIPKV